ncbi:MULTISPECIES: CPBP family intramembrane glutamic endopeptidase [unclassified Salinibacterium]|uniref:CPBP family intramembrane glutamic endopeptidase n=1 Tax=unclassified Salinibacterium TaxID=2632331 RepID=UPI0014227356|nr:MULTISPECIES: CPBP family intramembrane glutamic endopeptidase [unclassified Salinibacterium]
MAAARTNWTAVIAFVVIAFSLAWLLALPLWLGDGLASPFATLVLTGMMLTPTIAALVVTFAFRAPAVARARYLGLWPLRPAKRIIGLVIAAVFGPIALVLASIAVAAAFGWVRLDLENFSAFAAVLDSLGAGEPPLPIGVLVALQLLTVPLGSILNLLPALGEELGWRGWLLPALRPLGTWPALVLSGAIWGLWHSPAILLGYNYGLTDLSGVALMTLACIAWGVLFGWLRLRSGSVWPAAVGHASLNGAAGMILLLAHADQSLDMALAGPVGVAGIIVVALVTIVLVATGQFRIQPELAAPRGSVATDEAASA